MKRDRAEKNDQRHGGRKEAPSESNRTESPPRQQRRVGAIVMVMVMVIVTVAVSAAMP